MKILLKIIFGFFISIVTVFATGNPAPAPNGITLPTYYKNWRVIGVSHRSDNNTLRVIIGNDTAVTAARSVQTLPWPDGSILGKLVWKNSTHPNWDTATVPGDFVHAEFMIKDSSRYGKTGGWGYARWLGMNQVPYGKDEQFVKECLTCHDQVKNNDSVFTHPVPLP